MIKPRAGEAGEGVNDTDNMFVFINHDEGVNRVMVHRLTGFHNLRILINSLWVTGHDLFHFRFEECLTETLHCPTNITVGDDTN